MGEHEVSDEKTRETTRAEQTRRARQTAMLCVGIAAGMVGLAYAAVPLYQLFCQVTGFGGTPRIATEASGGTSDRRLQIRFDSNVSPTVPWRFVPEVPKIDVALGETHTVFYTITNTSKEPVTAVATYNVQPDLAGAYFTKLQCFCFDQQTLGPGESMVAPVVFYVDAELEGERDLKELSTITLSYTMFKSKVRSDEPDTSGRTEFAQKR